VKSITIFPQVKDEFDLVKINTEFDMKMRLSDSDFLHLLLEHDINKMSKRDIESARFNIAHAKAMRRKSAKEARKLKAYGMKVKK